MQKQSKQFIAVVEVRLLNRELAAIALSISVDTLDVLRKRGCPSIQVPGTSKVVFDVDDVARWMKEESNLPETPSEKIASEELDLLLNN